MNYATLFETIKGFTENDFPNTQYSDSSGNLVNYTSKEQIDTFIQQAEQRIYNSVQFPSIRKNVTGVTYATNPYLSSPIDFLAVYSLAVIDGSGNYEYLLNKDVNFLRAAYPNPNTTGIPKYYALFGPTTTNATPPAITNELSFMLAPTPDNSYTVELHYYYYPESIVTAGTTWLGDNFDSALQVAVFVIALEMKHATTSSAFTKPLICRDRSVYQIGAFGLNLHHKLLYESRIKASVLDAVGNVTVNVVVDVLSEPKSKTQTAPLLPAL